MAPRFVVPRSVFRVAGRRAAQPAFFRYNSSSATRASQIAQFAAQAEKPSAMEASVPLLWAICGGLTYVAFNRQSNADTANVDKLIIV
ncbi:hypothetical protein BDV96DRAFT_639230 [Lophiotrema nucula]|uniref:Uncharacterized protein n=1 Tax=Lophiotrema nucula TaxID=690887 RepID=A0A6A5ZTS0_9PLEO|nr:hypothetical protein BDV96DRAFT_639230 [Lophiotrema nucula]